MFPGKLVSVNRSESAGAQFVSVPHLIAFASRTGKAFQVQLLKQVIIDERLDRY
jgi:hypothetical protein